MVEPSPGASCGSGRAGPEALLLCACCRQRFGDTHRDIVQTLCARHAIRWERLYRAAVTHCVAPLVGANLAKVQGRNRLVPREIQRDFKIAILTNRELKKRAGSAAAELLAYCNERSVPVLLIKGTALDHLVYQLPYSTVSGDIDLVLAVRQDEVGRELMTDINQFVDTLEERTGSKLECDWFSHHDITMKGLLPVCFRQIWENAAAIRFRGQAAFVMCPEDLLIAACISCHRRRYSRLKVLCDLAETVARYPELDWDHVWSKSLQYQCSSIVYAALVATRSTLGLEIPLPAPPRPHVSPARARLIRALFGQMDRRLLEWGTTYAGVRADWSLIKTYASLPPHQLGRRLKLGLKQVWRRQSGQRLEE